MNLVSVPVAYMPLVDAAPLIAAHEMGFAQAEGVSLDLIAAPSWSSVRDMLAFGRVDAAHLLSPVPIAMALGLGGVSTAVSAVSVLSVNGNVIGVGQEIEARLRASGFAFDFTNAHAAGAALAEVIPDGMTVGVPFPFSLHAELLKYWIAGTPLASKKIDIRTVPPPLMARALAEGEIDAFCVGEPWGSVAVEQGTGSLLLPCSAIWASSPEKVLAVRTDWAETEPDLLGRLMRAVWRACKWLALPESRPAAAALLSRSEYLDVSSELIDRALTGHITISNAGETRQVPHFLEFHHGVANFPWRSQAKWIGSRLAQTYGLDLATAQSTAASVFRSDLFRDVLGGLGADMPGASEKIEGSLVHPTAIASADGHTILPPDQFFDGKIFDPIRN